MSEAIKSAKDRMITLLTVDKELRKMNFDEFEDMPKEYLELRVAFDKVIDSEYGRFRGLAFKTEKREAKEHLTQILNTNFEETGPFMAATYSAELKPLKVVSTEIKIKIKADTSEIDEAIVKTKILNDELEKAKSLINEMASSDRTKSEDTKTIIVPNMKIDPLDIDKISKEVEIIIRNQQGCR